MSKYLCSAALFVYGLLAVPQAQADICGSLAGNVVANCGFETGTFSNWSITGNQEGGLNGPYWGIDSTTPNSGSYEAYFGVQGSTLGQVGPVLSLSQTLSLLPAEYYRISFYLDQNGPTDAPGYTNYFAARLNGVQLFSETNAPNSGGYVNYTLRSSSAADAVSAANSLLQFDFQNDSDFFFFDDVSVDPLGKVPEPASLLLAGPFLGGLAFAFRRKRSRTIF